PRSVQVAADSADASVSLGLLLIIAATTMPPTPHRVPHRRRLHFADVHGRTSRWRRRPRRHDPPLGGRLFLIATIHRHQPPGLNPARIDQIILRPVGPCLPFTGSAGTPTVTDDVALRARIGLQLVGEVVEPGFLVVAFDVPVLVKLTR